MPNPPATQSVCPTCKGETGHRLGCDYGLSPDTQTEERCGCCGKPAPNRGDSDPWQGRMDAYCEGCAETRCDAYPGACRQLAPPDPQGQVERGERDCGVCGVGKWTGDEIVEVPVTHDGYSVPRCSIHRDCAPYQAESQLDQAERRAEEVKRELSRLREGVKATFCTDHPCSRCDELRSLLNPSSTSEGDA